MGSGAEEEDGGARRLDGRGEEEEEEEGDLALVKVAIEDCRLMGLGEVVVSEDCRLTGLREVVVVAGAVAGAVAVEGVERAVRRGLGGDEAAAVVLLELVKPYFWRELANLDVFADFSGTGSTSAISCGECGCDCELRRSSGCELSRNERQHPTSESPPAQIT